VILKKTKDDEQVKLCLLAKGTLKYKMKYQKSKFSLIFRIISLMLIQAFLVMDIAWSAVGSLDISHQPTESATLAPKLNLNTEDILNSYIYRVNLIDNINAVSPQLKDTGTSSNPSINPSESGSFLSTVGKAIVETGIIVAIVLTFSGLWSAPADAKRTVDLSDIVVSANKADLNKYIEIINSQNVQYVVEEKQDQMLLIRIKGLFSLNAEKLSNSLNLQARARDISNAFIVISSDANWEQSQTYGFMNSYANQVAGISEELRFERIDQSKLMPLYEGVTRVESNFRQWKLDANGKIVILKSYTNAQGVTQVIESQAVEELARLIVSHKGGISGYAEIINELERMISSDREKLSKAIKQGKQVIEETEELKQFNVYNDFVAYKNASSAKEKKQIIQKIHKKINSNPKLITVNLYYALAVWEYLQKTQNLQAGVNSQIAESMGKIGQEMSIQSESGGYKPADFEKAGLQFERDYFRAKLINKMLDKKKIDALLQSKEGKTLEKVMEYLSQQMMRKIGNQKLGYTYLTLNWDRYRRLELRKTGKNKYEFIERPLSYFQDYPHGFSVELATVASYNAGSGSIDTALLNFGNAVDERHVPVWIKNMVGANPNNVREPIDYLGTYLADRSIHNGDLTQGNENIKNELILERYKRIYKVKGGFLQKRDLTVVDGVKQYKYYNRTDGFNYKLAALFAQVAGIDYVNKFLGSYGLGEKWEAKILSSSQTFEILASVLADNTSSRFKAAKALKRQLNSPQQLAALAAAEQELKSREQARLARIELAKQMAEKEQWRNTVDKIKNWAMGFAIVTAVIFVVGAIAGYMKRRVDQGKQAVPAPVYRIPLRALGWTFQALLISGKIIINVFKLFIGFLGKEKSQVSKRRSSVLDDQKAVSANRRIKNQRGNNFFSITFFIGISLAQFIDPSNIFAGSVSDQLAIINTGSSYFDTVIRLLIVGFSLTISKMAIQRIHDSTNSIKNRELIDRAQGADVNTQAVVAEAKDRETSLKDKFKIGQLDSVVFVDVDLMRLTNQYVAKNNVNALLEILEQELQNAINDLGAENAVSLRRGGDEFVLAINSGKNKQKAVDIAAGIKAKVQNTKFSVASIGTDNLSAEKIAGIENFGCRIDKLGKHNIIIIAQEVNGKTGKARVQEFLDMVNLMIPDASLSIASSWLNRPAVGNEVRFTLSIGLANSTEIAVAEGNSIYEKIRNLAAQRKDKSKDIFKKLGDGHIESQSDFEHSGASGESILLTDSSRADFNQFENIQNSANQLESNQITDGLNLEAYPDLRYFSTETAARTQLNLLLKNKKLNGAIAFSLQGLDYYDKVGKIDKYQKEYYDAPGAVKDNRVDIRDFKVVNEAHGYVAGDEILARLRTGAMRFAKIFENFDVILARGPPAGPNGFLVPKTEQARQMEPAEVEALFAQYMQQVKSYFNQSGESVVKVGHLRVLWDRIKSADQNIGEVMERISQARAVHEYTSNPEKESDRVFQYGDNIQETWMILEEKHANQAVEQLANLQAAWQQNKQQLDALVQEAENFNSSKMIAPLGSVLLDRDIALKSGQSI